MRSHERSVTQHAQRKILRARENWQNKRNIYSFVERVVRRRLIQSIYRLKPNLRKLNVHTHAKFYAVRRRKNGILDND